MPAAAPSSLALARSSARPCKTTHDLHRQKAEQRPAARGWVWASASPHLQDPGARHDYRTHMCDTGRLETREEGPARAPSWGRVLSARISEILLIGRF